MKFTISISLIIFFVSNLLAQNDSIVLMRIDKIVPYDSAQAISDIKKDSIFILKLFGYNQIGTLKNSKEELNFVGKRFGFSFKYDYFEAPIKIVVEKQDEYNKQVYRHLDSTLSVDSEKEINTELTRLLLERIIVANQSNESIRNYIRKEFRKEDKEFKNKLIEADKLYRDRKYDIALEKYQDLKKYAQTEKCLLYLQTSEYHCLLNLEDFDKAEMIRNHNINRTIKRIKH